MKTRSDANVPRSPAPVQPARPLPPLGQQARDWDHGHMQSIPADVEPCCDIEWLEREALRLDQLGHDAAHAAARVLRMLVVEMDGYGVWSIACLDARRAEAAALAATSSKPRLSLVKAAKIGLLALAAAALSGCAAGRPDADALDDPARLVVTFDPQSAAVPPAVLPELDEDGYEITPPTVRPVAAVAPNRVVD
jgi:hypothetical protein